MARDLLENGGNGRKIELDVRRRVDLEGLELEEYMRTEGEKNSHIKLIKRDVDEHSSDSDDDIEMNVITGKHDIVVRPEGRAHTGFFKSSRKQHAMFPFYEEKIRLDDYGEIIQLDDYKLADVGIDASVNIDHDNKENNVNQIKAEDGVDQDIVKVDDLALMEKPTKCVNSRKLFDVNAQVQFIDFEGRSDGDSLFKILSQLRPRRVVVIRGAPENIDLVAKHCSQSIGARVFTPNKGDVVDATSETHIYQVKLTEALVSKLHFQKGKDAEVAWIDSQVVLRDKKVVSTGNTINGAGNQNGDANTMDVDENGPTSEFFKFIIYLFFKF